MHIYLAGQSKVGETEKKKTRFTLNKQKERHYRYQISMIDAAVFMYDNYNEEYSSSLSESLKATERK